jgi:hypothetical protein
MRKLSMNDRVFVKLTEHGRQLMLQNYTTFWAGRVAPYKFKLPQEDEDGWSRWQLWMLMEEFGQHIHIGMRNPFDLTICLEEPKECKPRKDIGMATADALRDAVRAAQDFKYWLDIQAPGTAFHPSGVDARTTDAYTRATKQLEAAEATLNSIKHNERP